MDILHQVMINRKHWIAPALLLALFIFAGALPARSDEAEFRLVVSTNGGVVDGDFSVDLEMKVADSGASPQSLNSLTLDIGYGSGLAAYPAPDTCAVHWSPGSGYEVSASKLSSYYRVLVTGNGVPDSGGPWPVTHSWQRLVTLRWKIAVVKGSYEVSMSNATDAAAFFATAPPSALVEWNTATKAAATVKLSVKLFLQGPFDAEAHHMNTILNDEGYLPAIAPYAEDSRTLSGSMPAAITDWLLLQLRSTATGATVCSKSVLLRNDGQVVEDDGTSVQVSIPTLEGEKEYYIVAKHRNHLGVMSNMLLGLSALTTTSYDYSTGLDKYNGEEAKEIEPGVFVLFAGDADGSGVINTADYFSVKPKVGFNGHSMADVDLSTIVNTADYFVIKPNVGRTANIP
jgi:hypothetical protein